MRPGLRVIPELRAAHIEEIDRDAPRRTVYFRRNYDLPEADLPPHIRQASLLGACRATVRVREGRLELFEPLWSRYLPAWLVLAALWRLTSARRKSGRGVVFFAIENLDAVTALSLGIPRLRPLGRAAAFVLTALLGGLVDRCAFGSADAASNYARLLAKRDVAKRTFPDLLAALTPVASDAQPLSAAFIGALEQRKGVPDLLVAWEALERLQPGAHLAIVGDGPLRARVRDWCARSPASREYLGPRSRPAILTLLQRTAVLAAPSVRTQRWREQIGRPIQEALSCGLTVVTTTETGLTSFLRHNHHWSLSPDELERRLPSALAEALQHPLPRNVVLASLPARDGRLAADDWLHCA